MNSSPSHSSFLALLAPRLPIVRRASLASSTPFIMHEPDRISWWSKLPVFYASRPPFVSYDGSTIAVIPPPNGAARGLFLSFGRVKYCIFGCCLQYRDRACPSCHVPFFSKAQGDARSGKRQRCENQGGHVQGPQLYSFSLDSSRAVRHE